MVWIKKQLLFIVFFYTEWNWRNGHKSFVMNVYNSKEKYKAILRDGAKIGEIFNTLSNWNIKNNSPWVYFTLFPERMHLLALKLICQLKLAALDVHKMCHLKWNVTRLKKKRVKNKSAWEGAIYQSGWAKMNSSWVIFIFSLYVCCY